MKKFYRGQGKEKKCYGEIHRIALCIVLIAYDQELIFATCMANFILVESQTGDSPASLHDLHLDVSFLP